MVRLTVRHEMPSRVDILEAIFSYLNNDIFDILWLDFIENWMGYKIKKSDKQSLSSKKS